eukprot:gene16012-18287_t
MAVNAVYAEHNGYSLTILDESGGSLEDSDSRWNKVAILERALHPTHGWAQDVDFLVWIDADFVFLDFNFRLESVVSEAQNLKAHIFVSAEHAGSSTLINSGCIMVRNSEWARTFLSEWWTFVDRRLFSDQEQFDLLYESRRKAAAKMGDERLFTDNIVILPPDKLNSDPPAMVQQKAHNQVLHLMGEETQYRVRVFREGLRELCRHYSAVSPSRSREINIMTDGSTAVEPSVLLAPQLTLTQPNLLRWAVEEYSNHSKQLLKEYEDSLPTLTTLDPAYDGPIAEGAAPQDLHNSRTLANAVHHFAHANLYYFDQQLQELNNEEGPHSRSDRRREGITLRKKVYQLLRRNLVAWKKLKKNQAAPVKIVDPLLGTATTAFAFEKIRQDWPELLKISAIAGQHLLSVTEPDLVSMREKRHVAGEILSMMEEMMAESHPAQHDAILLMVADIHSQIGLLDQSESNAAMNNNNNDGGGGRGEDGSHDQVKQAEKFARAALQHFQLSLDITRNIAERSGKHILVSPLTLTANALASLRQYEKAFEMYEQALHLNAAHYGAAHESNIALLVDFGISLVHALMSRGGQSDVQNDAGGPFITADHALNFSLLEVAGGTKRGKG